MRRIKIFCGDHGIRSIEGIQAEVNCWLETHNTSRIIQLDFKLNNTPGPNAYPTVMIFYEDTRENVRML